MINSYFIPHMISSSFWPPCQVFLTDVTKFYLIPGPKYSRHSGVKEFALTDFLWRSVDQTFELFPSLGPDVCLGEDNAEAG